MKVPLVTIVIPMYNGEGFIKEAVDSVLRQTYQHLELLIIDDGSTDHSLAIVEQFTDERIRIIRNEGNRGITYSRNLAIQEANGTYLALLDSDDIAMSDRISLQVAFMEKNKQVAMCGGHASIVNEEGLEQGSMKVPVGEEQPSALLLFYNTFINSTLLFRVSALKSVGDYYPGLCEDYEMSVRMNERYPVANLDDILIKYRMHAANISKIKKEEMREGERNVIRRIYHGLHLQDDDLMVCLHQDLFLGSSSVIQQATLPDFYRLLATLKQANEQMSIYRREIVNQRIFEVWYQCIRKVGGRKAFFLLFKAPLYDARWVTFKMLRKVFKQSLGFRGQ